MDFPYHPDTDPVDAHSIDSQIDVHLVIDAADFTWSTLGSGKFDLVFTPDPDDANEPCP